ncbi:MAG TPA: hypothetical protein VKE74_32955 [Gemmataceae bacterium]|nr:hypothetical protein [Gemmataceae bacterium]
MGKGVVIALLILVGFLSYLAYRGVTVNDAVNWMQRQIGVKAPASDRNGAPHPNYIPVVR